MNWLLPLETLPGWPEAPAVSSTHMILLMGIAPLAVAAIVAILAFTPALGRRFRGELATDDPHSQSYPALEDETHAQRAVEPTPRHGQTEIDA
ncbi:hypothetical protein [Tessaracoccus antarcticus]|uniref:Uncharacterized protein n=1 Tax=Tessaracoccus antarcticus TaxID=2479848 RepID=A0A3M0FXS8_9ACTN|nr:hypothetical protein [Tessaracoccus antarcticus]RMB57501.1 hypothetical protein EAX62_15815 [Tessaracoccus antarcticus]